MFKLKIYSQNVFGDSKSEKIPELEEMGEWTFENRLKRICEPLSESNLDIVAFNEVRYSKNVKFIKDLMEEHFVIKNFANNNSEMSFHNILCLKKDSQWEAENWNHKWVAENKQKLFLSNKFSSIDGDPYGRCVGLVYLKHKQHLKRKVCVAVSHVVPFGKAKRRQLKALFSLNTENLTKGTPTIIVGDVNRFPENDKDFTEDLKEYKLVEVEPEKLVIPFADEDHVEFAKENIGTFTPWRIDIVYENKKSTSLDNSRLDAHVYTNDRKLLEVSEAQVKAIMFKSTEKPKSMPPPGFNRVRHLLDHKMVSDHLAIIATYKIK